MVHRTRRSMGTLAAPDAVIRTNTLVSSRALFQQDFFSPPLPPLSFRFYFKRLPLTMKNI